MQFADTLLKRCSGLKILSTSREALGVLGEAVYPVPSLELPDIQQMLEKFREYESVHLFEERAQLAQMDFSLTMENASSVAEICSRLDGIPLAIELAAARVNVLSIKHIAAKLQESFNLLTSGNRTALPRHQTLQAAIDWSYDLLTPVEQTLFQRLSVFINGWTLEAAKSVCSDYYIKSEAILELLIQLINKSLLFKEKTQAGTRYRMLETIRQYANGKLIESGDKDKFLDQHLKYFLALAETAAPYLIRTEQLEWLARLDTDYENLRFAIRCALSKHEAEMSLRLCVALGRYWMIRSYVIEGSTWLKSALSKPTHNPSSAETAARVKALYQDAELASFLDDIERMTTSAEESLKLARVGSDRLDTAIAKFFVGQALLRRGDKHQATTFLQESLDEFQELNASYWEAYAYKRYGFILVESGEITLLEWASQKLGLARLIGERFTLADSLVGYVRVILKHTNDASKLIEEANSLFKQVGSPFNSSYFVQAELEWLKGEREKAKKIYLEIEERYGVLGEKYMRSNAIAALGLIAMEDGELSEAQIYFERALVTAKDLEDEVFISWRLAELAKLFYLQGDMDKFKEKISGSVTLAKEISQYQKIHPLVLILSTLYSQEPDISTQILGAIDSFFKKVGDPIFDPPPLERYYVSAEAHTCEVLGNVAFESAFAKGQKMSLEEALNLALKTVEEM